MNSPEIQQFIKEHSALFWYTPEDKKPEISHEFLVETILNYGDLDAVRKLIQLLGINHVSDVFFSAQGRKKLNYYPEIHNFFTLFFHKYAHRDI
jgi:hypothetical protein